MLLWRLSGAQHAQSFDGGYGLLFDGRWNSVGHAVTYCATSPSLCVLEKLVHIEDPALMPALVMVTYEAPDDIGIQTLALPDLPPDWRRQEGLTQQKGTDWHRARSTPLLAVPSAIVPLDSSPDINILVNHTHPGVADIKIKTLTPFTFDPRLF